MSGAAKPYQIINSLAPIRIADCGGWTDTWFARYGSIFNIAVTPSAEVQLMVHRSDSMPRITLRAENYGEQYTLEQVPDKYDKHPLLEAAIAEMGVPEGLAISLNVYSNAPVGCSTGTSAAVSVALIGALDHLTHGRMLPHEIAQKAHRIETDILGLQCGIQDQICSAYGGINYIQMYGYPDARVSQVRLSDALRWELESRLILIFVGQSHQSSEVHEKVIAGLADSGPDDPRLARLRQAAEAAKTAVAMGDLEALGRVMIDNTEGQRGLHEELVGARHQKVIDIAAQYGAPGWKVNGAGGSGGSVTLLADPDAAAKRAMIGAVLAEDRCYQYIPVRLCAEGLRVWESRCANPDGK